MSRIEHRQAKYLNNRIEADHGPIKRLCWATLGFKSMKTAYAPIKGFGVIRMIRERQCILAEPGITGEVRFAAKLLGVWACRSKSAQPRGGGLGLPPAIREQCQVYSDRSLRA